MELALVNIIISMCSLKGVNFTEYQTKCIDHYNNCLVTKNGDVDLKQLNRCQLMWEKIR